MNNAGGRKSYLAVETEFKSLHSHQPNESESYVAEIKEYNYCRTAVSFLEKTSRIVCTRNVRYNERLLRRLSWNAEKSKLSTQTIGTVCAHSDPVNHEDDVEVLIH